MYIDSDWAGFQESTRGTRGGIVTVGDHVIKTYSGQHKVIALSSTEAQLYAIAAAFAEALSIAAYARDLGATMAAEIYIDSSAALGISRRSGVRSA